MPEEAGVLATVLPHNIFHSNLDLLFCENLSVTLAPRFGWHWFLGDAVYPGRSSGLRSSQVQ